jgi:hypothetical protein
VLGPRSPAGRVVLAVVIACVVIALYLWLVSVSNR